MKPFQFSLEAVLTLRQNQEQRTLELYAAALSARRQASIERDIARHQLERVREDLRQQLLDGNAIQITQAHDYSRLLEVRLHLADQQLAAAEQSVAHRLQSMIVARQEREMIETLRDRQLLVHSAKARRLEERLQDELSCRLTPVALTHGQRCQSFV